jgi:hypothetical protein
MFTEVRCWGLSQCFSETAGLGARGRTVCSNCTHLAGYSASGGLHGCERACKWEWRYGPVQAEAGAAVRRVARPATSSA